MQIKARIALMSERDITIEAENLDDAMNKLWSRNFGGAWLDHVITLEIEGNNNA